MADGYCFKYDVSLPVEHFQPLVDEMRRRTSGQARRVVGYGHVGDGMFCMVLIPVTSAPCIDTLKVRFSSDVKCILLIQSLNFFVPSKYFCVYCVLIIQVSSWCLIILSST